MTAVTVGIVANPVSARDIRRLVANANGLQIADRANIVLRVLAALAACGVDDVLMMPDNGGIRALLSRQLERSRSLAAQPWPRLRFVDMPVESTIDDTLRAVSAMAERGVKLIVVLGGDGTHRAVASRCGSIPIAGLSTGTNNAFPDLREPTVTGLAAGLYARGRVPAEVACRGNKLLQVAVNGAPRDIALVDVAVTSERFVGARALWKADSFRELLVTFASPDAIGMSAIAGLVQPVGRWDDPRGLYLALAPPGDCPRRVQAPIAPGMISAVGVRDWRVLRPGQPLALHSNSGSVALDGEREIEFSERDRLAVSLHCDAFYTIDVGRTMRYAAERLLLVTAGG